jgi:hypothetical protein
VQAHVDHALGRQRDAKVLHERHADGVGVERQLLDHVLWRARARVCVCVVFVKGVCVFRGGGVQGGYGGGAKACTAESARRSGGSSHTRHTHHTCHRLLWRLHAHTPPSHAPR